MQGCISFARWLAYPPYHGCLPACSHRLGYQYQRYEGLSPAAHHRLVFHGPLDGHYVYRPRGLAAWPPSRFLCARHAWCGLDLHRDVLPRLGSAARQGRCIRTLVLRLLSTIRRGAYSSRLHTFAECDADYEICIRSGVSLLAERFYRTS